MADKSPIEMARELARQTPPAPRDPPTQGQLEALRAERDHWKARAEQLEREKEAQANANW